MIALRLVRLIETHSEVLAQNLVRKIDSTERCSDLSKVPREELEARCREVYQNLTDWLIRKHESDIEREYRRIGRRRVEQGVRFSHFYWAIIAIKEDLYDFLNREGVTETPLDLRAGFELIRLIEQFFERAILYAAYEYEQAGGIGHKEFRTSEHTVRA
jgi:hypothetical protein